MFFREFCMCYPQLQVCLITDCFGFEVLSQIFFKKHYSSLFPHNLEKYSASDTEVGGNDDIIK